MIRMYARALKGQRARGSKPQKRGKNISLLTALSLNEVVASINIYGAVDGVTFEAFIANELVPKLWKNACVVFGQSNNVLADKTMTLYKNKYRIESIRLPNYPIMIIQH